MISPGAAYGAERRGVRAHEPHRAGRRASTRPPTASPRSSAGAVAPDLPVLRLRPEAARPERAHPGDAGLDLVAVEARDLAPGARVAVPTGIAVAIPPGHAGLVLPRSGLARRHGVTRRQLPRPDRRGLPGRAAGA